jgi:hypothetical protein
VLINAAARALGRHKELADILVGVAGDFVPPGAALSPVFVLRMIAALWRAPRRPAVATPAALANPLDI